MSKPNITDVVVTFMQEGDERNDNDQELKVTANWIGDGHYLTIETARWSIDDTKDLTVLLDRVMQMIRP